MRKFSKNLLYIALLGFMVTIAVNLTYHPQAGRIVFVLSCICSVFGIMGLVFVPTVSEAGEVISRRSHFVADRIAYTGAVLALAGLVMRWFYSPGGEMLMLIGGVFIFVFFLISVYKVITYKK